jgi:hypothetical protein
MTDKTKTEDAMTTSEKIDVIINPNTEKTFKTTFSISTANMLMFEEELHKYGACVTCAVKENTGNWTLSVERFV